MYFTERFKVKHPTLLAIFRHCMTRTGHWKEIPTLEQFLEKKDHVSKQRRQNDVIGIAACKELDGEDTTVWVPDLMRHCLNGTVRSLHCNLLEAT